MSSCGVKLRKTQKMCTGADNACSNNRGGGGGDAATLYPSIAVNNRYDVERVICYTPTLPVKENVDEVNVSCVKDKQFAKCNDPTDKKLVEIPAGAIVDSIEYFGIGGFHTSRPFTIGLGTLNNNISMPLILDGTSEIANSTMGGSRNFINIVESGECDRNVVLYSGKINVYFEAPVTRGKLAILITYHRRPQ